MELFLLALVIGAINLINSQRTKKKKEQRKRETQTVQQHAEPELESRMDKDDYKQTTPEKRTIKQQLEELMNHVPDIAGEVKEEAKHTPIVDDYTTVKNKYDVTKEKAAARMEQLKLKEQQYRSQAEVFQKRASNVRNSKRDNFSFVDNNLVNGIILTEVLGPPRSKKSFTRK